MDARATPVGAPSSTGTAAAPEAVAASVAPTNVDWLAVQLAVEEGGAPLGVAVQSFQGVFDQDPLASPTTVTSPTVGKLTLSATAPSVPAVADWLDAVTADPTVRRTLGGRLDDDHRRGRIEGRAVHDGHVSHRREPRRPRFDNGGSRMNRSRKDITLMFAMGALLLFAVFNFVFKPQRSELAAARSDLQQVEQRITDAELTLRAPTTTVARSSRVIVIGNSKRSGHRQLAATTERSCRRHRRRAHLDLADAPRREPKRSGRLPGAFDHRVGPPCGRSALSPATARLGSADGHRAGRPQQPGGNGPRSRRPIRSNWPSGSSRCSHPVTAPAATPTSSS